MIVDKVWKLTNTVRGYVHGRGHPAILQTDKSPGPVVDPKDPTKIFF